MVPTVTGVWQPPTNVLPFFANVSVVSPKPHMMHVWNIYLYTFTIQKSTDSMQIYHGSHGSIIGFPNEFQPRRPLTATWHYDMPRPMLQKHAEQGCQ